MNARVEVEYLAKKDTAFRLQFDGLDRDVQPKVPAGVARGSEGDAVWHRRDYGTIPLPACGACDLHLTNAAFLNSQRDGADFRLEVVPPEIHVRRVTVTREPVRR